MSNIIVNYDAEFQADPTAMAAFQFAVDIWERLIISDVDIVINASWDSLASGILGSAGPWTYYADFTGQTQSNSWHAVALANKLYGSDLNGGTIEITTQFNNNFSSWYFGTDAQTPFTQWDFVSVVLHELGHGLGFSGGVSSDGTAGNTTWAGLCCPAYPTIYSRFVENGTGTAITSFANNTQSLLDQLTGNDLFFDGTNTTAANGSTPAEIYAPGSWNQGSSYSHLGEGFNGTPHALMTYSLNNGEAAHDPGAVTLGIFQDMGWMIQDCSCPQDLVVDMTPVTGTYEASQTLSTSGAISVTSSAVFNAPEVTLNADFSVAAGATFEIQQTGCN